MRFLRSLFKFVCVGALLLAAVVDGWVRGHRVGAVWVHGWCRRIVRVLGVEWSVVGELPEYGAVVSNHLSYLDVLLYIALKTFVMVAKSEFRGWPLI